MYKTLHAPTVIIENIVNNFLPYRQLKGINIDISNDKIIGDLSDKGYFKIEAIDKNEKLTTIIILNAQHKCSTEKSAFDDKIITPLEKQFKLENFKEAIILIENELYESKRNIISKVALTQESYPKIKLNIYKYSVFVINIPKHESVDEHIIISEKDLLDELHNYSCLESIKHIKSFDPPIIWLGGNVGQYIKVIKKSLTAGLSIDYYKIVS